MAASITQVFSRVLRSPAQAVRTELIGALRHAGFKLVLEQLTFLEARRGSQLGMASLRAKHIPISVVVHINPGEAGCGLAVRLSDRILAPLTYGVNGKFREAFAEIEALLDAVFRRLDPNVETLAGVFHSKMAEIAVLEKTNNATAAVTTGVGSKVVEHLEGGPKSTTPGAWKEIDGVTFRAQDGYTAVEMEQVQAILTVARLLATLPGSMPPALVNDVETFAGRLETTMMTKQGVVLVDITDVEKKVLTFLQQQAWVRERLPLRTLHTCTACKFQKITNPDYERMVRRNQKLRALGGSVGATFGRSGISPFVMVGTLFRFARLDPDYVCGRCQGTEAEERIITFCPQCGDLCRDAALRVCTKCSHDFRKDISTELVWQPYAVTQPSA